MTRILVVEDEPEIRDLSLLILHKQGWDANAVTDGHSAYLALKAGKYDLVLSDWMMPGLTGIEFTQLVRADPEVQATPIILLTARHQQTDLAVGYAAGVTDYLIKPFSPRELVRRVKLALDIPYGN